MKNVQLVYPRGIIKIKEIGQVRRRRINIEEATGTSYTEKYSLCFPFYTDCIIIVRNRKNR